MRYTYGAKSSQALCDIDTDRGFRMFLKGLPVILPLVTKMVVVTSRPHHWHVFLELRTRHRYVDLIALQAWLGSDIRREFSSLLRAKAGCPMPVALIEFARVPHWDDPDIICRCSRRWKRGRKMGECPHLRAARGRRWKQGYLRTHLETLGASSRSEAKKR